MEFYEIEISSVPQINFVYNVSKNNYKNTFSGTTNLLEITLCLEGNVIVNYNDGKKRILRPFETFAIVKNYPCNTFAEKSGVQRHITFGVNALHNGRLLDSEKITHNQIRQLEKNVLEQKSILIPIFFPLREDARTVESIISRALNYYISKKPEDILRCQGIWYELCGFLASFVLRELRSKFYEMLPSDERYVADAIYYINENLSQNLKLRDIADASGISVGYLQNLFSKVKGITVIEYINRQKIEIIKNVTAEGRVSLKEAAKLAGINDQAYASRLFKKIMGISFDKYLLALRKKEENTVK